MMSARSPFPRKALPQAGDSLRDAAHDLIFDKFFIWVSFGVPITVVGLLELSARWLRSPISPWLWIIAGAFCGIMAVWRWFGIKPELNRLVQGIRGEREVGRMLEEMRVLGYAVFHDLPGDGFNVDHVLVGPGGVFAIETKAWSMPDGKRAEIDYDGKRVLVNGFAPDRDPVMQAEAVADHLRKILNRTTDRNVAVRPVVLFPGWWVTCQPKSAKVWVLNPKALKAFLQKEPVKLSREDIALYADRMSLHLSNI